MAIKKIYLIFLIIMFLIFFFQFYYTLTVHEIKMFGQCNSLLLFKIEIYQISNDSNLSNC
ncbi:hypothetical protein V1477_004430 [Vespula maculifrons]|uniref:Uncharacterized protein n=1 Tax=Vespula maculifrons TaxID=7453 RepID=A0ABD2CU83_VESMC